MRLLRELGYERVRPYPGGMAEWASNGGPFATVASRSPVGTTRTLGRRVLSNPGGILLRVLDAIAARSVGQILAFWLAMVLAFGIVYWLAAVLTQRALLQGGVPVPANLEGLGTSIYFSFTTATSVGYGDVTPAGSVRGVAMFEATLALLIFGFVVAKFLGRRQEQLVEEIHRISFEERLDRVQSSLHFVLAEIQSLADGCADSTHAPPRTLVRLESVVVVFASELRTIHDLLYRPVQVPEEPMLEGILANLKSAFRELLDVVRCLGDRTRSLTILDRNLTLMATLAAEICGHCVPRQYAPDLESLMDEVQSLAHQLKTRGGA